MAGIATTAFGGVQNRSFRIGIDRMQRPDGGATFEVDIPVPSRGFVHLPNGEIVPDKSSDAQFADLVFDSFSALKEAFVGEWTIESPMTPFAPQGEFTFEVFDFPESILGVVPPNIVSPAGGSSVPPIFLMTWAYPPGVMHPNSIATLVRKYGPEDRAAQRKGGHAPSTELSAEILAEHSGGGLPQRLELRAGTFHPEMLADFVSDVTPQQEPTDFTYDIRSTGFSFSTPIHVFVVVPEPSVIAMLATGFPIALTAYRRRKAIIDSIAPDRRHRPFAD
jgi:hypothetical protein